MVARAQESGVESAGDRTVDVAATEVDPAWKEHAPPITFWRFLVETPRAPVSTTGKVVRAFVMSHLREQGLDVRGAEGDLFDIDHGEGARYALGTTLEEVSYRPRPVFRELAIQFKWELLDLRTEQVVYRGATTGYTAGSASGAYLAISDDIEACIEDALERLLARPLFVDMLTRDGPAELERHPAPSWEGLTVRDCGADRELPTDFEALLDSVVTLKGPDGGHGSGAFISPDGFLLTAAHVVDAGVETARLRIGVEVPFEVVRVDREHDVALLHAPGRDVPCLPLADKPPIGAEVWAVGTPLTEDLELSVSKGIVSGLRTIDGLRLVQTDAAISPGYSGGPLVAENGRMVGVISFKAVGGGAEGLAFAIPSTAAAERLGLWFGEASDELPEADLASFGPAVAPAVEDVIEPLRTGKLPPALASELRSRQGARLAGGLSLVAVGIGTSLAASAVWSSDDAKTPAAFGLLHTADVAGWAVALTGAWLTIDTGRRLVELKSR